MSSSPNRVDFLHDKSAAEAFERELMKFVGDALKLRMAQLISPENVQRFRHGSDWSYPGLPNAYNEGMQQHSSEVAIQFNELADHDISAISRYVGKLVDDLNAQFQRMIFTTISAACHRSGNVVNAPAAGGPMEGLAAVLETIRFSADRHGNVQRPQFHLSPEAFESFRRAHESAPPELLQRIQQLDEIRSLEAIQEEIKRKGRFARYGEGP